MIQVILYPPWWNQYGEFINNYITPMARFYHAGVRRFRHRPLKEHSRQLIAAAYPEATHTFDVTAREEDDRVLKKSFWDAHDRLPPANVNAFARAYAGDSPELTGRVLVVQRGSVTQPRRRGFSDVSQFKVQLEEALCMPVDVYSFEAHSLKRQAEIIHSYRYIVLTHGAGMCYVRMFHREGAIVYHLSTPLPPYHETDHPRPHYFRDWALGYSSNGLRVRNIECMLYDMTLTKGRPSKYGDCVPINQCKMEYYDVTEHTLRVLTDTILSDVQSIPAPLRALRAVVSIGGFVLASIELESFDALEFKCDEMRLNDYPAPERIPPHGYFRHKDTAQTMNPIQLFHKDYCVIAVRREHDGVILNGERIRAPPGMLTIMLVDPAKQRSARQQTSERRIEE